MTYDNMLHIFLQKLYDNLQPTATAQPGIAADRFAREISAILEASPSALAAAECQSVGRRHYTYTLDISRFAQKAGSMSLGSRLRYHWPVCILFGVLLLSVILTLFAAITYIYDQFSLLVSIVGMGILLAAVSITWLITRSTRHSATSTSLDKITHLGLVLGLLWVIEITINNAVAPPLPARDIIDNIFWAVIAIGMLVGSIAAGYHSGRASQGIRVGTWSGFVSGVVACGMALSIVVFGMSLLLSDPLNIAEWSGQPRGVTAPTMAAYFAYETFAGAFLHLTVLGIGMGFVLGMVGGALGALTKRGQRTLRREQR